MCTNLSLHEQAGRAAEVLLKDYLGLPLLKAINLSTPQGFDQAVAALAQRLRAATAPSDARAVRRALAELDVDWTSVPATRRAQVVHDALAQARRALQPGMRAIEAELGPAAEAVLAATRRDARGRQRLRIAVDFNAVDERMLRYLRTSETLVLSDAYGRRLDAFSREVRRAVADGLERGLGRRDMAQSLEHVAQGTLRARSDFYWETVASAFTGRGRSYGLLSAFAEAGLDRYRLEAVLDEQTTPTCRFLHGKEFTVRAGLEAFARAEAEPERLKELSPWVREQLDPTTGRRVLYVKQGDQRLTLAEELRSGLGRRDDVGAFRVRAADAGLESASVLFPPFHGACRTTLLNV